MGLSGVTVLRGAGQALRKGWMRASGGELSLASGTAEGWISVKIFFFFFFPTLSEGCLFLESRALFVH